VTPPSVVLVVCSPMQATTVAALAVFASSKGRRRHGREQS
jgi:hypothetical protein